MKFREIMWLLAIIVLSAVLVSGQAISTDFTGQTVKSVILTYGTFQCPGGDPAGPFPPTPPCTPGSRVHVRGMLVQHDIQASDPRMSGRMVFVFNANTDGFTPFGAGSGPLFGTWRMEVTEGGTWEGTYTGERKVTAAGAVSTLKYVGEGTGGRIEGAKVKFDVVAPHTTPAQFKGRILEPALED